ncbi:MAG: 2-C-methyl-D-erythritol 2,4-cyclodiphosphate synthase [Phycisphaerae bacterium]|jgi:2-C-methyl-D-erythritol 2,4-cyclodiphosphate synthase
MYRTGLGYDSHRLIAGRPLILGGVRIAYERGLEGHSDADAALHAITDAILGALAAGDIGEHFPDTDPRWAGADSAELLSQAVALAGGEGYIIVNCDLTIFAEWPKLSPHKAAMQARIAQILGVGPDCVGVKAKTNEHMGFIGRGEGIAALAAILIKRNA